MFVYIVDMPGRNFAMVSLSSPPELNTNKYSVLSLNIIFNDLPINNSVGSLILFQGNSWTSD